MANNRAQNYIMAAMLVVAFLAGGWVFTRFAPGRTAIHEVEDLYVKDGESVGIFDQIPPEELAEASAIAAEGLQTEIILPEENEKVIQDGTQLPSQIVRAELSDIAGIAPKKEVVAQEEGQDTHQPVDLKLTGNEVVGIVSIPAQDATPDDESSNITLIAAPVRYKVIHNTQEYKEFKRRARGSYPTVDFTKQMLVVLESDSNLPDNVFELIAAETVDGNLQLTYRVNVFKLDEKINSHTVLPVAKTQAPIQLKQVL